LHRRFGRYGIDIARDPVLVYPAQHYQNGGFLTDDRGRSSVENLYVVGEVAGGVHGRNRLGGNSLIDIFVFGRRAGIDAAESSRGADYAKLGLDHIVRHNREILERGLDRGLRSPLVLPDYRYERALAQIHQ